MVDFEFDSFMFFFEPDLFTEETFIVVKDVFKMTTTHTLSPHLEKEFGYPKDLEKFVNDYLETFNNWILNLSENYLELLTADSIASEEDTLKQYLDYRAFVGFHSGSLQVGELIEITLKEAQKCFSYCEKLAREKSF